MDYLFCFTDKMKKYLREDWGRGVGQAIEPKAHRYFFYSTSKICFKNAANG